MGGTGGFRCNPTNVHSDVTSRCSMFPRRPRTEAPGGGSARMCPAPCRAPRASAAWRFWLLPWPDPVPGMRSERPGAGVGGVHQSLCPTKGGPGEGRSRGGWAEPCFPDGSKDRVCSRVPGACACQPPPDLLGTPCTWQGCASGDKPSRPIRVPVVGRPGCGCWLRHPGVPPGVPPSTAPSSCFRLRCLDGKWLRLHAAVLSLCWAALTPHLPGGPRSHWLRWVFHTPRTSRWLRLCIL